MVICQLGRNTQFTNQPREIFHEKFLFSWVEPVPQRLKQGIEFDQFEGEPMCVARHPAGELSVKNLANLAGKGPTDHVTWQVALIRRGEPRNIRLLFCGRPKSAGCFAYRTSLGSPITKDLADEKCFWQSHLAREFNFYLTKLINDYLVPGQSDPVVYQFNYLTGWAGESLGLAFRANASNRQDIGSL